MRGVALCVLAAIGINAVAVAGPAAGASMAAANQSGMPAAANQSYKPAIASVQPARGAVVGVAHPVVVTFSAPVADKRAAEGAIDIKSVPAMTGKFQWLDNDVVQWVPDQFWPAHSTVALSMGGVKTNFATGPAVIGVAMDSSSVGIPVDGPDGYLLDVEYAVRFTARGLFVHSASLGCQFTRVRECQPRLRRAEHRGR